jgi:hypothetical protein
MTEAPAFPSESDKLRAELDQLKRELAELPEAFERHLKNPVYEKAPQIRPNAHDKLVTGMG